MPLTRPARTAYGADLAHVHDAGHGGTARRGARDAIARLRRRGVRGGLVVDLGCGSGIASRAFLRAGYDVLGIDVSPAMLAIARRRTAFAGRPRARLVRASFVDATIPPCVAVVALGEVLGYAFDRRNGRAALEALARRVRRALSPRGVFVLDVLGPGAIGPRPVERRRSGPGWRVAVRLVERRASPPRLGTLTRDIVTTRRLPGGRSRTTREVHRVRLFPASVVAAALARAGFSVRRLSGYGGERFPRTLAAFAATPRS